jgi:putative membrane protein insertion efficiency factor
MIERINRSISALLIAFVRMYQLVISPVNVPCCRYHPTCSNYAIIALREHGPWRGMLLATWRILRCNPWSDGGADPVPEAEKQKTEVKHVAG